MEKGAERIKQSSYQQHHIVLVFYIRYQQKSSNEFDMLSARVAGVTFVLYCIFCI